MERFLEKVKREKRMGNVDIYNYKDQLYAFIYSNTGNFSISRQIFESLENFNKNYNFILVNRTKNTYYFLTYNNFELKNLKQCFQNTSKESLYFGKQILQNIIEKEKIIKLFNS